MRASRLRHKVTVEAVTESQDSFGEPIKTWSTHCVRKAGVEPLTGREFEGSDATQAELNIRFVFRHDSLTSLITEKMRINWNSRFFDIQSIINLDYRNKTLFVICRELK